MGEQSELLGRMEPPERPAPPLGYRRGPGRPGHRYLLYVVVAVLGAVMFAAGGVFFSASRPQLPAGIWQAQRPSADRTLQNDVDMILSYQDSFLSIVLWTLGLVTAIGAAGIGFNLFIARDAYERDLDLLRTELGAASQKNQFALSGMRADIRRRLEFVTRSVQGLETLKQDLESLRDDVLNTKCELWMREASTRSERDALLIHCQILEAASKSILLSSKYIPTALDRCTELLSGGLRFPITTIEEVRVCDVLRGLPEQYRSIADRVQQRLLVMKQEPEGDR